MVTDDLIIKVLSGNANSDEVTAVNAWRKVMPENERRFSDLNVYWEKSLLTRSSFEPNTQKAWERINTKLIHKPADRTFYYRIAAGLALLIGLTVFMIYIFSPQENSAPLSQVLKDTSTHIQQQVVTELKTVTSKKAEKLFYLRSNDSIKESFLPDSTLVILNKNSQLIYADFATAEKRIVQLRGEAHFDVKHTGKDFIVATRYVDVQVVGTSFIVGENKANNTIEIYVEEGTVKVYEIRNPGNMVLITSGQKYAFQIKDRKFVKIRSTGKAHWWKKFFSKFRRLFHKK